MANGLGSNSQFSSSTHLILSKRGSKVECAELSKLQVLHDSRANGEDGVSGILNNISVKGFLGGRRG
jgi:hypothetical protein